MKTLIVASLAACALVATLDMEGPMGESEASELDYFVFIYRRGPMWSEETAPFEQEGLKGHFRRMEELEEAGIW